jgi:hypothetical protein
MTPIAPPFNEQAYRDVARVLCTWATDGENGVTEKSERYQLVTEGRDKGPNYSSCADLAHWLLYRLGVRSKYLNRAEDSGGWEMGRNVSNLAFGPDAKEPTSGGIPRCGDIWIIWSKPNGTDAHVLVVDELEDDHTLHSWEYGQAPMSLKFWKPNTVEGKHAKRALRLTPEGRWQFGGGRILKKVLPLWATLQAASTRGELLPLYELPK